MRNRASGYITEIGYLQGYSRELAPAALSLAALNRRVRTRASRPLRYLELGFGQGLSLNIHAAACPGEYWGVDINPAHVANARPMADASGSHPHILEGSFTDILACRDLPEFDIIAASGVWSWISPQNRAAIVDIVRSKLADGGMLYLSYNCTPGWSPASPLRHLLSLHADLAGAGGKGILDRVDGALDFAQRVADMGIGYFKANPVAAECLGAIKTQNRAYVAHEFFNGDWEPMPFSRVAELLAPANVSFAVSANLLNHLDGISLSPAARKLLGEIDHPVLRETVRDYLIDARYRQDIFVKGGRPMVRQEQEQRYLAQAFALTHAADEFPAYAGQSQAVITLQEAVITLEEDFYQPLIEVLAENSYAPKTLRELATHPRLQGRVLPSLIAALIILAGAGIVRPTQAADLIEQARPRCKALNAYLIGRLPARGDNAYLASAVIGGGVAVSRSHLLFMQALQTGRTRPEDWARFAWDNFFSNAIDSIRGAKPIAPHEESLAALTSEANAFSSKRLPILRALEIA